MTLAEKEQIAIQMYRDGVKVLQIELELNMSGKELYSALKREGIPQRNKKKKVRHVDRNN